MGHSLCNETQIFIAYPYQVLRVLTNGVSKQNLTICALLNIPLCGIKEKIKVSAILVSTGKESCTMFAWGIERTLDFESSGLIPMLVR